MNNGRWIIRIPRRLWARLLAAGRRTTGAAPLAGPGSGAEGASVSAALSWRERWPRLVEPALIGLLALLGLAVLVTAIQGTREWMSTRELHETYTQLTNVRPSAQAVQTSQHEEMVKRLSTHRLIAPPPAFQLTGVLGDAAIFNGGMLVKVGDSAGDMKILAVGPNSVEVSTNGQTQKLYVFQPQMAEPATTSAMPGQRPAPAEKPSSPTNPESPSAVRRSVPPLPASKSIAQP